MALPVEEVQGVRQDEQRIMTSYLFPSALRPMPCALLSWGQLEANSFEPGFFIFV